MAALSPSLDGSPYVFAIVVSRFNPVITEKLLSGAQEALQDHGVLNHNIDVLRVPGAFEIPVVAQKLAQTGRYQAIICLGAVIRGEADALSNAIYAQAYGKDPEFFAFTRSLTSYERALQSSNSSIVLSPDSAFFDYLGSEEAPVADAPAP